MFGVTPATRIMRASPRSSNIGCWNVVNPATSSNALTVVRRSAKSAGAMGKSRTFRADRSPVTNASRSLFSYGSGWSSTVLMTLKIAVVAPMPRAIVTSAVTEKTGDLISVRMAKPISRRRVPMRR